MNPVYVGGTSAGGTGASYNVSLTGLTGGIASSPSKNDLVLVCTGFTQIADQNPGITSPAGFTEIEDTHQNDSADANMSVNWKLMGSTPDTSITVTGPNSAAYGGATVVHVWRFVDYITPFDATAVPAGAGNTSQPNAAAITTVTANAVVVACAFNTGTTAQAANTTPSGMSNGISFKQDGTTYDGVASIASIARPTAGAYDPAAWTPTTTGNTNSYRALTLALRPLASKAKIWNGSAWVEGVPKVWTGAAWTPARGKIWDGTDWFA